MDRRFWNWNRDDPRLRDHPLKVTLDGTSGWQFDFEVYRCPANGPLMWGQSFEEGGIHAGPDSGFRALNFTDILGPKTIYLVGYDYRGGDNGKQDWWHEPHKVVQKNHVYKRYRTAMEKAHASGRQRANIINLSPDSALEVWPRTHWSDIDW